MDKEEITARATDLRDRLPNLTDNGIDYGLRPVPPFRGTGDTRLILIGQDPTIRDKAGRRNIISTLNLDTSGPLRRYVEETICHGLGIDLENVYATNLFKYFYTAPPADTPHVLEEHLAPNLGLLSDELSAFRSSVPVITLGEPVLRLLVGPRAKVRTYWNYTGRGCHHVLPDGNALRRMVFPFPHQRSSSIQWYKETFPLYLAYMKGECGW